MSSFRTVSTQALRKIAKMAPIDLQAMDRRMVFCARQITTQPQSIEAIKHEMLISLGK